MRTQLRRFPPSCLPKGNPRRRTPRIPPPKSFPPNDSDLRSFSMTNLLVSLNPKCVRVRNSATTEETQETQPRRSSRFGKGNGGSIQQLQRIERIQSGRPSRQSTRSLDEATQGQEINAMAPSHSDAAYDDGQSQLPSWAESPNPRTQVLPTFALSKSSQFGFKPPSQMTARSPNGFPHAIRP